MNEDQMEVWQEYLVGQMHERYGLAKEEGRKTVARWLRSLGRHSTASEASGRTSKSATPVESHFTYQTTSRSARAAGV
jgi:hypothetical protein